MKESEPNYLLTVTKTSFIHAVISRMRERMDFRARECFGACAALSAAGGGSGVFCWEGGAIPSIGSLVRGILGHISEIEERKGKSSAEEVVRS